MKRSLILLLAAFFTLGTGGEVDEPTVVENMQLPHWQFTRAGVTFDISEKNIRVENGRNEKIFVEIKKVELNDQETPLVAFEVGAPSGSITIDNFGSPVQSQALINQKVGLGTVLSLTILTYAEHMVAKSDRLVARAIGKLKNKEIKAPEPQKIHTEKVKLL